jgi:hypothetical protein
MSQSVDMNLRSIHDIFVGEFKDVTHAVVQKLRPDAHNLDALKSGFTESWPALKTTPDVVALSFGKEGSRLREIWAGFTSDIQPCISHDNLFRFYVDRFRRIGTHDLDVTPDAKFYGTGGGGGARVNVIMPAKKGTDAKSKTPFEADGTVPEGAMERRLVWVRKNHRRFRDPVWKHWDDKCAVTDADCNGLLIASHIHPWARSKPHEQTDFNNGLLLSAPLDALFDRGWISFDDSGQMIVKPVLSPETRAVFGLLKKRMRIGRMEKVTEKMRMYLRRHRDFHGFEVE